MIHDGTISTGSGCTVLRLRRVADQLDQAVAQHHLARRDGDVAADLEALGLGCTARRRARPAASCQPVASRPAPGARRRLSATSLQHHRVGRQPVGRRQHAQPLAGEEVRHARRGARSCRARARPRARTPRRCESRARSALNGQCAQAGWRKRGSSSASPAGSSPSSPASAQRVAASCVASAASSICRPGETRQVPGPVGPGQRQRHRRQAAASAARRWRAAGGPGACVGSTPRRAGRSEFSCRGLGDRCHGRKACR